MRQRDIDTAINTSTAQAAERTRAHRRVQIVSKTTTGYVAKVNGQEMTFPSSWEGAAMEPGETALLTNVDGVHEITRPAAYGGGL